MKTFTKFNRCYFNMAKEVFENIISHKRLCYLRNVLILLYSTRLFLAVYVVFYLPKNKQYILEKLRQVDPLVNMAASNSSIYEPIMGLVAFCFVLFDFVCQRAFYKLDVNKVTWKWWYELIVLNQDAYFRSRVTDVGQLKLIYAPVETKIRKKFGLVKHSQFIVHFLATVLVNYNFKNVNFCVLFKKPFTVIPQISPQTRLRVLRFCLGTDMVSFVCLLFIAFLLVVFNLTNAFNYSSPSPAGFPWYSRLLATFDSSLVFFVVLRMCQSAFFFTNCTILGTIVYTGYVKEVYASLTKLITKNMNLSSLPFTSSNRKVVANHIAEHNKVCYLVVRGCIDLFGGVLLSFLCTHIPVNVFLVRKSILSSKSAIEDTIPWVIIFFQSLAAFIVFAPLAWCAQVYHRPKRFIPRLMLIMVKSKKWLPLKLKYDDLYGRLTRGPKIAINIGPVESITFFSALQSLFLYIGFLLMAFKY